MSRRPAGEYIHKITVNQYTEVADAAGQLVPTQTFVCSRFARKDTPRGQEITLPEGQQQLALNTVILCLPWDSVTAAITAKMMVTYQGNEYELTAARDITGRREEIQLDCLQRV